MSRARKVASTNPRLGGSSPPATQNELQYGTSDSLEIEVSGQRLHLTNLNKIYFPKSGLKKRDLLAYYHRMAPYVLPFLAGRPLVLRRYPDGEAGKTFFQKEAPSFLPKWMETATVYSNENARNMQYVMAKDAAALLYLTNLGCIDHNPWSSRAESQENPDYLFFDLDPTPGTPFSRVIELANRIHAILEELQLTTFLKTSGASGFHIFVPLKPLYTYEQTRHFAEIIGHLVEGELSNIVTFERIVRRRPRGRILVDALQNAKGKPLACAYSVRAEPLATVSTPVTGAELQKGSINPAQWNLVTIEARMKKVGDLWKDFWKKRQTLDKALSLLELKIHEN
jgi:bifunctional non-homologous end joining protein LigD